MDLKVIDYQNNSDECIVCGLKNDLGLHAHFYICENDIIVSTCIPKDEHQSYPDRMHGGVICAILDETLGRAVQIREPDIWGVTGNISIKYRRPVPLGSTIYTVGKILKSNSRGFEAIGFIEDENGKLLATATATYIKVPVSTFGEGYLSSHEHWFRDTNTPKITHFDIKNYNILEETI